jgi:hypothetical protein
MIFARDKEHQFLITLLSGNDKLVTTNLVVLFNFDFTKTQRFFLINFSTKIFLK